jgi:hypothetical protein
MSPPVSAMNEAEITNAGSKPPSTFGLDAVIRCRVATSLVRVRHLVSPLMVGRARPPGLKQSCPNAIGRGRWKVGVRALEHWGAAELRAARPSAAWPARDEIAPKIYRYHSRGQPLASACHPRGICLAGVRLAGVRLAGVCLAGVCLAGVCLAGVCLAGCAPCWGLPLAGVPRAGKPVANGFSRQSGGRERLQGRLPMIMMLR